MFIKNFITMASIIGISSCTSTNLYTSSDFTAPGSFTAEAEGPAVDAAGNLYAVSFDHKETIGKISPDGKGKIFIKMPKGSTANGIRFNQNEEMFIADYTGHNVLKADLKGNVSVFAHEANMNQPNDLAIMDNGILFASDPNWAEGTGQMWKIDTKGKVSLLEKNMGTTNGIEVSTDQKRLYVNESKQLKIWVYDLTKDGDISNKRLLHSFKDGGLDGMRCDSEGNIYVARWSSSCIAKLSPSGNLLETIKLKGQQPTNIAFGGPDGKTAYVTVADRGNIETFRVENPGRSWSMRNKGNK
ncbi:SMP-30/gluconolactonase/LRE family protein [Lentisphaera profundi]|uniref:SMP-30/gluconolactonase/LRE family protein n=1 Tax=Lentisphaera profundi TaxID=1658616 RepID=A0ABY7VZL4_9BACT|nr:SMP-30/gluconolactonase/LRE family protein [Lentisphaera profundi]WDE99244.1 SMP-30/gluconolactonase/LRE family protein [Lentisphaera profundi]